MYKAHHWALYHMWFQNKSELYNFLISMCKKQTVNTTVCDVCGCLNNFLIWICRKADILPDRYFRLYDSSWEIYSISGKNRWPRWIPHSNYVSTVVCISALTIPNFIISFVRCPSVHHCASIVATSTLRVNRNAGNDHDDYLAYFLADGLNSYEWMFHCYARYFKCN